MLSVIPLNVAQCKFYQSYMLSKKVFSLAFSRLIVTRARLPQVAIPFFLKVYFLPFQSRSLNFFLQWSYFPYIATCSWLSFMSWFFTGCAFWSYSFSIFRVPFIRIKLSYIFLYIFQNYSSNTQVPRYVLFCKRGIFSGHALTLVGTKLTRYIGITL